MSAGRSAPVGEGSAPVDGRRSAPVGERRLVPRWRGVPGSLRAAVRGAFRHAAVELRIQLFSWNVLGWLLFPALGLFVLHFLRGTEVMGSEVSLAQLGIPGVLAMALISGGMMGVAGQLLAEREDGTLLRAKAIPNGVLSHLMGNMIVYTGISLGPVLGMLVIAAPFFDGVTPTDARGWLTFVGVSLLGLLATLPIGALFGAVLRGPMMLAWASLVIYGSMAISGIFYPITALPGWLQVVGQVFPMYWLGHALRWVFLPEEAAALELGGRWNLLGALAVIALWGAVGLALTPRILGRMAQRESGSAVEARKVERLQRLA